MTPSVHFLGVGDATCAEGANTSILYTGSQTVLIDCGPTVPQPLFRVLSDPEVLDAIWITHQHADHWFGLPTLLLRLRLGGRRRPLELLGGPGSMSWLREGLELGYPGSFQPEKCYPMTFTEVTPECPVERAGVRWTSARTQHRVPCHAIRIDDGRCSMCVSGDGKPTPASLQLYQSANLVIHECEWATRVTHDHSNVRELGPVLEAAALGRVAVVHCNDDERDGIAEIATREHRDRIWLPKPGEVWSQANEDKAL